MRTKQEWDDKNFVSGSYPLFLNNCSWLNCFTLEGSNQADCCLKLRNYKSVCFCKAKTWYETKPVIIPYFHFTFPGITYIFILTSKSIKGIRPNIDIKYVFILWLSTLFVLNGSMLLLKNWVVICYSSNLPLG